MTPNNPTPFRFSFLQSAENQLRELARLAVERNVRSEFARDLRTVQARLHTDPTDWGDPLFDYHHLGMTHWRGRSDLLYVYFSVHLESRVVFVQNVEASPYGSLAEDGAS